MPKPFTVDLCPDCIQFDTGWQITGRPLPEPRPMSLLEGHLIGPDERDHICEGHFSRWPCDGCGTRDAGMRYCYTAVRMSERKSS